MHADDTECPDTTNMAAIRVSEIVVLLNISCFVAPLRPRVEAGVRFLRPKARNAHSSTKTAQLGQAASRIASNGKRQ